MSDKQSSQKVMKKSPNKRPILPFKVTIKELLEEKDWNKESKEDNS